MDLSRAYSCTNALYRAFVDTASHEATPPSSSPSPSSTTAAAAAAPPSRSSSSVSSSENLEAKAMQYLEQSTSLMQIAYTAPSSATSASKVVACSVREAAVSRPEASLRYLVARAPDAVFVAIDAIENCDQLLDCRLAPFGSGHAHQMAAELARLLPASTFVNLCTENSNVAPAGDYTPSAAGQQQAAQPAVAPTTLLSGSSSSSSSNVASAPSLVSAVGATRHLVLCGSGLGGAVAHLAALVVRELVRSMPSPITVAAVSFSSPLVVDAELAEALRASGDDRFHMSLFMAADADASSVTHAESLMSAFTRAFSFSAAAAANACDSSQPPVPVAEFQHAISILFNGAFQQQILCDSSAATEFDQALAFYNSCLEVVDDYIGASLASLTPSPANANSASASLSHSLSKSAAAPLASMFVPFGHSIVVPRGIAHEQQHLPSRSPFQWLSSAASSPSLSSTTTTPPPSSSTWTPALAPSSASESALSSSFPPAPTDPAPPPPSASTAAASKAAAPHAFFGHTRAAAQAAAPSLSSTNLPSLLAGSYTVAQDAEWKPVAISPSNLLAHLVRRTPLSREMALAHFANPVPYPSVWLSAKSDASRSASSSDHIVPLHSILPTLESVLVLVTPDAVHLHINGTNLDTLLRRHELLTNIPIQATDAPLIVNNVQCVPAISQLTIERCSNSEARLVLTHASVSAKVSSIAVRSDFGDSNELTLRSRDIKTSKQASLASLQYFGVDENVLQCAYVRGLLASVFGIGGTGSSTVTPTSKRTATAAGGGGGGADATKVVSALSITGLSLGDQKASPSTLSGAAATTPPTPTPTPTPPTSTSNSTTSEDSSTSAEFKDKTTIHPILQFLMGLEQLLLESSQLDKIVKRYGLYGDVQHLAEATEKARAPISKMIERLSQPISFKVDSASKRYLRAFGNGIGVVVGSTLTVVSSALAVPGVVLAAPLLYSHIQNSRAGRARTALGVGGIGLALIPGLCAYGSYRLAAHCFHVASRGGDLSTQNYVNVLKILLSIIDGDPAGVLEEIPALEAAIIDQFAQLARSRAIATPLYHCSLAEVHRVIEHQGDEVNISGVRFGDAPQTARQMVATWLCVAGKIGAMRQLLERNLIVSFIGSPHSGKTTAVHRLFALGGLVSTSPTSSGDGVSTRMHRIMQLSNARPTGGSESEQSPLPFSVDVVDFTGSSTLNEQSSKLTAALAATSTLFVIVLAAASAPSEHDIAVTSFAKGLEKDFIVVVNKVDSVATNSGELGSQAEYAKALDIDPSLIFFMSIRDNDDDVERLRALLFARLIIYAPPDAGQPELAFRFLHPILQSAIEHHFEAEQLPALKRHIRNSFLSGKRVTLESLAPKASSASHHRAAGRDALSSSLSLSINPPSARPAALVGPLLAMGFEMAVTLAAVRILDQCTDTGFDEQHVELARRRVADFLLVHEIADAEPLFQALSNPLRNLTTIVDMFLVPLALEKEKIIRTSPAPLEVARPTSPPPPASGAAGASATPGGAPSSVTSWQSILALRSRSTIAIRRGKAARSDPSVDTNTTVAGAGGGAAATTTTTTTTAEGRSVAGSPDEDEIQRRLEQLVLSDRGNSTSALDVPSKLTSAQRLPGALQRRALLQNAELLAALKFGSAFRPVSRIPNSTVKVYGGIETHLSFDERVSLFHKALTKRGLGKSSTRLKVEPNNVFDSLVAAIMRKPVEKLRKGIKVSIEEDKAIDAGGVSRGIFAAAAQHIAAGNLPDFVRKDSGVVYFGQSTHPNPEIYRAVGRMIGIVLINHDNQLTFPCHFAISVFKILLGKPVTLYVESLKERFLNGSHIDISSPI